MGGLQDPTKAPSATLAWARTTVDASPDKVYAKIADMREWQSWLDKDPKAKSHTHGLLSSGDGFHYTVGPNRVDATVIQAHPGQDFVWTDHTLMGLIQSQHKYSLRKVGGGWFKPSKTEITVKQELSGPLKWLIKGKDLEKQMRADMQASKGFFKDQRSSLASLNIRSLLLQGTNLGLIVTSALIIWKTLILFTGSESPIVVVLSGSMEPGFYRGDILFLYMSRSPVRTGEIVVFNLEGRDIPIVHRAVKVHERVAAGEINILTKGDNNSQDDRVLYNEGQKWLDRSHIMGRVVGCLPHVGQVTIILNDYPKLKYLLIGVLGLFVLTSKE
ncbi:hypothetical protein WJX84_008472 [Apatococcus fuscideae]|uniref:Signal peptidase complex catalytic subunit SEC11 n=1 Tax=Apatococcus fuscideae TaxID=2026836 RepID=A0AAW1SY19_9CHLO